VIIRLAPPPGAAPLDPAAAQTAADVLSRFIAPAREATGPGGHVAVVDRWVGTHPHGASLAAVVHAGRPRHALDAVTAYITHGLDTVAALRGWTITDTHVEQLDARAAHQHAK
jgi:hypothetical protein